MTKPDLLDELWRHVCDYPEAPHQHAELCRQAYVEIGHLRSKLAAAEVALGRAAIEARSQQTQPLNTSGEQTQSQEGMVP